MSLWMVYTTINGGMSGSDFARQPQGLRFEPGHAKNTDKADVDGSNELSTEPILHESWST